VTGALVQWVRDNLGLIGAAPEIETLAGSVPDSGGCYSSRPSPASSPLLALGCARRHRRPDGFITKAHIARPRWRPPPGRCAKCRRDERGLSEGLTTLKADGGMTANTLLMQFQADVLDVPVVTPQIAETTCLGAAYAAGLAVATGQTSRACGPLAEAARWTPSMAAAARGKRYRKWKKAVQARSAGSIRTTAEPIRHHPAPI